MKNKSKKEKQIKTTTIQKITQKQKARSLKIASVFLKGENFVFLFQR